jgi:hypothetical protein
LEDILLNEARRKQKISPLIYPNNQFTLISLGKPINVALERCPDSAKISPS